MITLRGKLTRTLVERKPPEPKVTRSSAVVDASPPGPDGVAAGVPPAASGAQQEVSGSAAPTETAADKDGEAHAESSTSPVAQVGADAKTAAQIEGLGLIEEWTWRGVWAFGDLPSPDDEIVMGHRYI